MTTIHDERNSRVQLDSFLAKFTPEMAKSAKGVLAAMRKRCPGAIELVYDNYNALAIGFATGERVRDVWFSIAVYPNWASIFFFKTLPLKDPEKLLKGSGKTTRHIVLADGAKTLAAKGVARVDRSGAGEGRTAFSARSQGPHRHQVGVGEAAPAPAWRVKNSPPSPSL